MCHACDQAREAPDYRLCADRCMWCTARRIQIIQRRLPLAPLVKAERCRQVLAEGLSWGLGEKQIRALAKQGATAIRPEGKKT